jgi:hypothetical protein
MMRTLFVALAGAALALVHSACNQELQIETLLQDQESVTS